MTKAALLALSLTACARPPQQEPSVVPGVPVTFDIGRGTDTVVFRRFTRAGQDTSAGTRTVVLQVVPGPDRVPLLEVEQRFPGGGGTIVDTAIAELHTLRAVAHRSHQPTRTMRFDFSATDAAGIVTTPFPTRLPALIRSANPLVVAFSTRTCSISSSRRCRCGGNSRPISHFSFTSGAAGCRCRSPSVNGPRSIFPWSGLGQPGSCRWACRAHRRRFGWIPRRAPC
jgi:hypothetical protein